ncbi:MAG TPA: hypothetical protein VG722_11200, partial [Tepidisphaeraceae bacterium]|nr:hypothetical protein [Tepidisphaeraceae bacterium]
ELSASNAALADQGKATPEQKAENAAYLKRLYIQWGPQTGGKRWHAAFERLRRQIAPDFSPGA